MLLKHLSKTRRRAVVTYSESLHYGALIKVRQVGEQCGGRVWRVPKHDALGWALFTRDLFRSSVVGVHRNKVPPEPLSVGKWFIRSP